MKNMKNLSTQTEVKIAAAEFFIKYMLEIYHQEVMERNKEAEKTADMIWRVETYLETLESNRF